ncbi:MAG: ribonuclease P protein component [Candidatus Peregrinibacteria bacterium Gr01-1014_25]|nr:MAG: ribonuclease P protein component [Candidatus Peregrinibacteria bacterium Gr01-1014_25]
MICVQNAADCEYSFEKPPWFLRLPRYPSFVPLLRLSGRKTCERVLRQGRVWKGPLFSARWIAGEPRNTRNPHRGLFIGTVVPASLDKSAVRRNRMRRRCREAMRTIIRDGAPVPTAQLLLLPRSASLNAPFPELQAQARALLTALSVACPPTSDPASSNSR